MSSTAEPAPATVWILHVGQASNARFDDFLHFRLAEYRIAVKPFSLFSSFRVVADFLCIEVSTFLTNLLEIQIHVQQSLLSNGRG